MSLALVLLMAALAAQPYLITNYETTPGPSSLMTFTNGGDDNSLDYMCGMSMTFEGTSKTVKELFPDECRSTDSGPDF